MTEAQAHGVVRTVEATWKVDFGEDGRRIWRNALTGYDYDTALKGVQRLAERQRFRPTVAELRETIRGLVADARNDAPALPEPKVGKLPEWVLVWRWLRSGREPAVLTPLPQQHPHHQPPYLTDTEYQTLRDEWVTAGQPGLHATAAQVIAT